MNQLIPQVLWEAQVSTIWSPAPISWPSDPDVWENARYQLATIIASASPASTPATGLTQTPRVYPNPWRADKHTSHFITFDQLTTNAEIRIFTVSGHLVRDLKNVNGSVMWDQHSDSGDMVASGLYLYLITDSQGNKTNGKLAIIR
jgi:hypothetical protein